MACCTFCSKFAVFLFLIQLFFINCYTATVVEEEDELLSLLKGDVNTPDYQCGQSTAGWTIPSPPQDGSTLQQVIAVIRHGDRTPYNGSKCWPDDEDVWTCYMVHGQIPVNRKTDESYKEVHRIFDKVFLPTQEVLNGNCSVGQLTSIGYSQHLANGHSLNAAYVKTGFLKQSLDSSEIYLRSSNVPRTILSAQTLIQGMFPPLDNKSNNYEDIQHLSLYTRDVMYDSIQANGILCPKYQYYNDQFFLSDEWLTHKRMITDRIVSALNKALDYNTSTYGDVNRFCDCLITHYCHELSWPNGMTALLYELAWNESTWQSYNLYQYPSVQENSQVGIGFLIKDILKNLDDTVNNEHTEKFHLYSGHDTTLMQLLVALQLNNEDIWPPFSSILLFELFSTPSCSHNVRVMYNGEIKKIPFCNNQEICDYETFQHYVQTIIPPDDYKEHCKYGK